MNRTVGNSLNYVVGGLVAVAMTVAGFPWTVVICSSAIGGTLGAVITAWLFERDR